MYDRSKTIGASDAVHIQAGKWAECYDWKQGAESDDWPLAAEIGKNLETFNLELFTRETGIEVLVSDLWNDDPITHTLDDWCKFLPDALCWDETANCARIPVEAKCINMMWQPESLIKKYMPQCQHAMRVMGAPYCYLSVIYLNTKYEYYKIPYDPPYDDALFEKEKLFMWFLETGTRPPEYKGKRKGWI